VTAPLAKPRMRLYVDESGDHTFRAISGAEWRKRYLCLLGCVFEGGAYERTFCKAMQEFKAKHFGEDPDERVILHREDIVQKRPPFDCLQEETKQNAFNADLLALIKQTSFLVIAVVIDKYTSQGKRYSSLPFDPYHVALLAMMERYCGLLQFRRHVGDVLAEGRGGNEDKQLKAAFRTVYNAGTRFHEPKFFQDTLTSKELKIKPKAHDIPGLQLADMLAHPVKQQILAERGIAPAPFGFAGSVATLVENKYNRRYANDQIGGYGKIIL
jgi:Protein of unknown function (DUF3800)